LSGLDVVSGVEALACGCSARGLVLRRRPCLEDLDLVRSRAPRRHAYFDTDEGIHCPAIADPSAIPRMPVHNRCWWLTKQAARKAPTHHFTSCTSE
jgi:hypothetical protein